VNERDLTIKKLIYEKYPKTEKERTCRLEKARLNGLRDLYRRRLISEIKQNKISGFTSK